mmetsp:Transcript_10018/g.15146  ORF Transcript_10018/g.15146 Transcript_10018/m.15146 type:complete len:438 (-) Transcript_10018:153-1466(-)
MKIGLTSVVFTLLLSVSFYLSIVILRYHNTSTAPSYHTHRPSPAIYTDYPLHQTLVQFISEWESRYLHCLSYNESGLSGYEECRIQNAVVSLIRRLHYIRTNRNEFFNTIQIGCLDGISNDPFFKAVIRPHVPRSKPERGQWEAYSLAKWRGTLVEPAFMSSLNSTYQDVQNYTDLQLEQLHFISAAVSDPLSISSDGFCSFYKVNTEHKKCAFKRTWYKQISGMRKEAYVKLFGDNYTYCVLEERVPCVTLGQVLKLGGYDVHHETSKLDTRIETYSGQHVGVWCLSSSGKQSSNLSSRSSSLHHGHIHSTRIDLLLVDVEGLDGDIVRSALNTLCPELWPAVIIYEDKVMRNYTSNYEVEDSGTADSVIEFLEQHGYYVMLAGEDAIAMRVGYSIYAGKHTPFPPRSYLNENERDLWLHPHSSKRRRSGTKLNRL